MNESLIWFILELLCSIALIYGAIMTARKYQLTNRDLKAMLICFALSVTIGVTYESGRELNAKLSHTYRFTKELYSSDNVQDSCISDSILSQYLKDMRVPHAKIIMAQAKLESNNYKSELYKSNYNLFGMKVATQRVSNTNSDRNGYQSYCNWRESVMDYVLWQFTNKLDRLSDKEYFEYLSKRYAEDPNYIVKLKKIIK